MVPRSSGKYSSHGGGWNGRNYMHVNKEVLFQAALLAAGDPPDKMHVGYHDYEIWKLRAVEVLLTDEWFHGRDSVHTRVVRTNMRYDQERWTEFYRWVLNQRGRDSMGRKLRGPI
jgi:hypothetical protein